MSLTMRLKLDRTFYHAMSETTQHSKIAASSTRRSGPLDVWIETHADAPSADITS